MQLQFLAPAGVTAGRDNADSCVLRLDDGRYSLLLVGDLPGSQEQQLLALPGLIRPVSWLVSGHHGSRHSSTPAWIRRLQPQWVLHSAGYANRWHFPDPQVSARFDAEHSRQWSTPQQGLIRIRIDAQQAQIFPFRPQAPWYRHLDAWLRGE